jgi:hypothetical protein
MQAQQTIFIPQQIARTPTLLGTAPRRIAAYGLADPVEEIGEWHVKAARQRYKGFEARIAFGALEQTDRGAVPVADVCEFFL